MTDSPLLLGPLLRHVCTHSATVWVQTAAAAAVTVRTAAGSWSCRTFAVHGHHYALVLVEGLEAGSVQTYEVEIDGERCWPLPGGDYPDSKIATIDRVRPTRLAFGSCRTSVPHNRKFTATHGVDALRASALDMAADPDTKGWPDLFVFLGDQVYADETSPAMQDFIQQRRGLDTPLDSELKDFVEYAHLYHLAWSDPANRWLLSTVPTAMIFDDHDVRDDWNTSLTWHEEMNATTWWHERIVGALASYWVYQHIGNLHPDELAQDPLWQRVQAHEASDATGGLDITEPLRALAEAVDADPTTYRFSYTRDLGDARLVMIDSRAARDLRPGHRAMLDEDEMAWFQERLRGGVDHLFIGTSLPFLMQPGIHDLEALNEGMSEGAWGRTLGRYGEKLREAVDLEHWAAFQRSFGEVQTAVAEVARGERGAAPRSIVFLSGDVHNSYVAEIPLRRTDSPHASYRWSARRSATPFHVGFASSPACWAAASLA